MPDRAELGAAPARLLGGSLPRSPRHGIKMDGYCMLCTNDCAPETRLSLGLCRKTVDLQRVDCRPRAPCTGFIRCGIMLPGAARSNAQILQTMISTDHQQYYDAKYARAAQGFSPFFQRQFRFLSRWQGCGRRARRILESIALFET